MPPTRMPRVAWRAGIDPAPIDVHDDDAGDWLQTLIWPGQGARRERLAAALALARQDPPRVVSGDLLECLPAVAATAPADATLVVFHSAVLAYMAADERSRFVEMVTQLPGHWISNEGQAVLPMLGAPAGPLDVRFLLAVDGTVRALSDPHGASVVGIAH